MKIIYFVVSICLLPIFLFAQEPPAGWRFPIESDYSGGWREYRGSNPTPFITKADFNGDGLIDKAWILLSTENKSWGLFLFISQKEGSTNIIRFDTTDHKKAIGSGPPQSMGVAVAPPGDYVTACAKGYWKCKPGEAEVLHLDLPGINYYQFEGANSIFWWDARSKLFKRTWISD